MCVELGWVLPVQPWFIISMSQLINIYSEIFGGISVNYIDTRIIRKYFSLIYDEILRWQHFVLKSHEFIFLYLKKILIVFAISSISFTLLMASRRSMAKPWYPEPEVQFSHVITYGGSTRVTTRNIGMPTESVFRSIFLSLLGISYTLNILFLCHWRTQI